MSMSAAASWLDSAQQLSELLKSKSNGVVKTLQLIYALNTSVYPIKNLKSEAVEDLVRCFVQCSNGSIAHSEFLVEVAKLTYNVLTYQKATIQSNILEKLLHLFMLSLAIANPPNELFYASATIVNLGGLHKEPNSLLDERHPLFQMGLTSSFSVETQRAALHFLAAACDKMELSRTVLLRILDVLLQSMTTTRETEKTINAMLRNKLLLSRLRLLHSLLSHLSPLPSLAVLLSTLKANMAVGLPGQGKPSTVSSIQPPLPIPQTSGAPKSRPMHSVAGPQERRPQGKGGRNRSKAKTKCPVGEQSSLPASEESCRQSSDSETSSSSASEVSLSQWAGLDGNDRPLKGKGWSHGKKGVSSSEGEVSDSDAGSAKFKTVLPQIRHQALSCLALIFQVLDHHTAFSYWLSFLPDGPRTPNSPPLLLACLLKDPVPRCRGAAVSILCAMLEGSKPYLTVADDSPRPTQPFTPYSVTIGGVVRELHRGLLLALTAEVNATTLTQLIKCLGLLVANCPYHQLSAGYIARVTATLGRLSTHRDVNVQVACLTCYGAVISIFPSHKEVEDWLLSPDDPTATPWLLHHCLSQLQLQSSLALQTEALQILAALSKFYFPQIISCWTELKDFYLSHLASFPRRVQQHVLKMLEELCRALSSSLPEGVAAFWEELLGGPLTAIVQDYSEHGALSAQACDILATISSQTVATIKPPFRMLILTLPLGLSKDDSAPSAVIASAVRVLGVFVLFDTIREDENFFLDSQSAISHCLSSPSMAVRVQAAWALANLMDSFSHHRQSLLSSVLVSLCEAVHRSLQDSDKVKCNGVRAAGNLLKQFPEHAVSTCKAAVENTGPLLAKGVTTGSMKSRWNACYACNSAFSNGVFCAEFASTVALLLSALCNVVQNCKNFKVRSNAALALSSAAAHNVLSGPQFGEVWAALVQALENSEQQMDFSEFKHAATLKHQLCVGICHLLVALPHDDATSAASLLPSDGELKGPSHTHLARFLARVCPDPHGGDVGGKDDDATRELVDSARRRLELGGGLKHLLDMFRRQPEEL